MDGVGFRLGSRSMTWPSANLLCDPSKRVCKSLRDFLCVATNLQIHPRPSYTINVPSLVFSLTDSPSTDQVAYTCGH